MCQMGGAMSFLVQTCSFTGASYIYIYICLSIYINLYLYMFINYILYIDTYTVYIYMCVLCVVVLFCDL